MAVTSWCKHWEEEEEEEREARAGPSAGGRPTLPRHDRPGEMWDSSDDELELVSACAGAAEDDEYIDMTPVTTRAQ